MTFGAAHNPTKQAPWLLDLHPNGVLNIRRRGRAPADGTDVVFATHSRPAAVTLRALLCERFGDNRYRLRQPMTISEARAAFARAAGEQSEMENRSEQPIGARS